MNEKLYFSMKKGSCGLLFLFMVFLIVRANTPQEEFTCRATALRRGMIWSRLQVHVCLFRCRRSVFALFHGHEARAARGNCTVAHSPRIPQGVSANRGVQCVGTAAAVVSLRRRRWSSCTLIFFGFSILIFLK